MVAPIQIGGGIEIGAGISIGNNGASFTLSSADFVNIYYGSNITPNSNLGFTTNGSGGPGQAFYGPILSLNNGGSPAKLAEIRAFWAANSLNTTGGHAYMFDVTWDAGSSPNPTVAIVMFYDGGDNNCQLDMGIVDTTNPIWQTDNTGYYTGPITTVAGTFNLPATFTLIKPLITDYNDWC